ncbi:unnamed protein product [Anisakis simplex]|uniref:SET domain-containing protein n=1 Tax=Anisakis simplex TaxID=6269 RepID=A0A0M3JEW3_ANISI|nr:unnamed protein product [Anisakis simplex]
MNEFSVYKRISWIKVFVTARKGMGLRCRDRIANGRFVIEYIGEVIGAEEVLKRISPINYVLTVNEFFIGWF